MTNHEGAQGTPTEAGEFPRVGGVAGFEKPPVGPELGKIKPTVPPTTSDDSSLFSLSNPLQPASTDDSSRPTAQQDQAANNTGMSNPKEDLKRWYIDKAARVISSNRNDPYLESQQLEEVKRGYLRDIYDREIKLAAE